MHDPADEDDYRRRHPAGAEANPDDKDKKWPDSFTDEQGRVWILRGTTMSKEDTIAWMVDYAVEEEMKRRHPDTYQDPDDKAGHA
jgi:hypothetical protein